MKMWMQINVMPWTSLGVEKHAEDDNGPLGGALYCADHHSHRLVIESRI